jgi:hypothetical protein
VSQFSPLLWQHNLAKLTAPVGDALPNNDACFRRFFDLTYNVRLIIQED